MQTVVVRQEQRPKEYTDAIEQLKNSFVKSIDIVQKCREIGAKYGLSSQEIRKDIEHALAGVVKPRQLRSLLPLELKHDSKIRKSAAATAAKSFQFTGKINRYTRGRKCIIISADTDVSRFEGKLLTIRISE